MFMKQMQRGHRTPNILGGMLGGRSSNQMVQNIFAPQQNNMNGMFIGQALFNNNNNPLPLLVQNWHSGGQNTQSNPIPLIKMTESNHHIFPGNDKPNLFGFQNQGNQGNQGHDVPMPPPNMFGNTNPFNQLFSGGNQPPPNMPNPYYNPYSNPYPNQNPNHNPNQNQNPNQPNSSNPFGHLNRD